MSDQNKVTIRNILQSVRVLSILFLALLIPLTGYTADLNFDLVIAVSLDDTATVNALLAKGASANAKDEHGRTALTVAANYGYPNIVNALLAKGADPNMKDRLGRTALSIAANYGYTDIVKALLAKGADINIKDHDSFDRTALISASNNGHIETVKALLAKGAEVNEKDEYGETALACARRCGHTKIARLLEKAGARE
jgi:ankyrin repeat protein